MKTLKLKYGSLVVYEKPKACNKWYLPVCAATLKPQLERLRPNHLNNWEEVDFGGNNTCCYVLTGGLIRTLNKSRFTAFVSMLSDCLGKGPTEEFFQDICRQANNIKAKARVKWESHHGGIRGERNPYNNMSIREAAERYRE